MAKEKLRSAFKTSADAAEAGVRAGAGSGVLRKILADIMSVNQGTDVRMNRDSGDVRVVSEDVARAIACAPIMLLPGNGEFGEHILLIVIWRIYSELGLVLYVSLWNTLPRTLILYSKGVGSLFFWWSARASCDDRNGEVRI